MSNDAVRKQLLVAIGDLNVPLDSHLSKSKVNVACGAAKLLRNRLLREHNRVVKNLDEIREDQRFGNEREDGDFREGVKGIARDEFVFIAEMMVVEKLALPLLLAHGFAHPSNLLPQLLKLITAMLLPIPQGSLLETVQKDHLAKVKQRCGSDENMSFFVQVVAPIAKKRSDGCICREDVVILEVVLKLLSLLLSGSNENITGSFCRNHGIEMLLVVINQNFAKSLIQNSETAVKKEPDGSGAAEVKLNACSEHDPEQKESDAAVYPLVNQESESDNDLLVLENDESPEAQMNAHFQVQVNLLLEGKEQLWKWNRLILSCMAAVLPTAPGEVLAQLSLLIDRSNGEVEKIGAQRNATMLQACKKEREKWRHIARSRSGALASNSLLVKRERTPGTSQLYAIGSVSTLLGSQRKDPLEAIRVMDNRKRGRFVKGMFQDNTPKCTLHIQTQLELSKQSKTFFLFGFEPLNTMIWKRLESATNILEEAAKEFIETRAGYKHSGEEMDVSSPFDDEMYDSLFSILHYMSICTVFLRYMREIVRSFGENETDRSPPESFQQLWQSLSNIISLSQFTQAFTILQLYLKSKEVGRKTDISIVIQFVTELLLAVQLLADGKIIPEPAVQTAAHALATSILYGNDTVKCLFDVLGLFTNYMMTIRHAHLLTQFTFSVFQLIDQCSFRGRLFVPKRRPHNRQRDEELQANGEEVNHSMKNIEFPIVKEENVEDTLFSNVDKDALEVGRGGELMPQNKEFPRPEELLEITAVPPPDAGAVVDKPINHPSDDIFRGTEEGDSTTESEEEWDNQSGRARSEAPSQTSNGTVGSSVASEREVAVSLLLQRLGTPKYIWLLVTTLRHWRTNDADMNLALVYLMEAMVKEGYGHVFFHLPFLLSIREVIVHGKDTHGPLYRLCDKLAFDFFNPEFAHNLDVRVPFELQNLMSGAQSSVGFEVGLRCARSLFCLGPVDYTLLEEKGMIPDLNQRYATNPVPPVSMLPAAPIGEEVPRTVDDGVELMASLKVQGLRVEQTGEMQRIKSQKEKVNTSIEDNKISDGENGTDVARQQKRKRKKKDSGASPTPHNKRRRQEDNANDIPYELPGDMVDNGMETAGLSGILPGPQDLSDLEEELLLFGA